MLSQRVVGQNSRILLVGDDKIGRRLLANLKPTKDLYIVKDATSSIKRIVLLVRKGRLSPILVLKMALSELWRRDYRIDAYPSIRSNAELAGLIREQQAQQVFLFRAGLIINKQLLSLGVDVFNLHCASLPDYGGLGAIERALKNRDYQQEATLHRVTHKIDEGEIISTQAFELDPKKTYFWNEETAYKAGIQLLLRVLGQEN